MFNDSQVGSSEDCLSKSTCSHGLPVINMILSSTAIVGNKANYCSIEVT